MCGRFVLDHPSHLLRQWYELAHIVDIHPRYDIAPGHAVTVVRATASGNEMALMRWGFIPSWADDPSCMPMLHNARGETVAEKPMFRHAFRQRRCLIPATGFYEWKSAAGQKLRQRYYLSLRDGTPLSFAGVWDCASGVTGAAVETCAIVTTKANGLVEPIHHRMPVLLDREDWPLWLDADAAVPELLALLRPYPPDRMQLWEVADPHEGAATDDRAMLTPLAGTDGGGGAQPALL